MWLVTTVGAVHGQNKFTFALEQKRSYSVGRDRACDIRYESRHVRPREGSVVVEDWDPTNRLKPPELRWKLEPKKNGTFGGYKTVTPRDENLVGSLEKGDYDVDELERGHGCFLGDNRGMGIELAEDAWFMTVWDDLHLQHDKMKDETEEVRETLRKYCVSWTQTFDISDKPNLVLSSTYKSSPDCNYAVCYAIRILLPAYLPALLNRFRACWKKVADSQDSFAFPDENDGDLQPKLDPALPKSRMDVDCWLPNESRVGMFAGWTLMGLRGKAIAAEKRYLTAMGGEYAELDVISRPLLSSKDYQDRLAQWLEGVDEMGDRGQALVVYFSGVKEGLAKAGIDFNTVVGSTSQKLGIAVTSGAVCWGAVKQGGVKEYIDLMASNAHPAHPTAGSFNLVQAIARLKSLAPVSTRKAPLNTFAIPDVPAHAQSSQLAPTQTSQRSPPLASFIPSTFPNESDKLPVQRQPSPTKTRAPRKQPAPEPEVPPVKEYAGESQSSARRPLKRRAGRPVDLFQDDLFDAPASLGFEPTQQASLGPASQPSIARLESSLPHDQEPQSMNVDSLMPSIPTKSRLKRRGGPETQQSLFDLADISFEEDRKTQETAADIRKLYEQTKVESTRPPSKRPRGRNQSVEAMEVDEDDPVQATLREAARIKKEGKAKHSHSVMPPPAQVSRGRSPTEEPEEVEETSRPKKTQPPPRGASPVKKATQNRTGTPVTKDEAFLQAITKASKSKKAVDELDKEFNQLRIPKPGAPGGSAVVKANVWDANHPDYTIVNEFNDELRGNFIQIIRKDLIRKDLAQARPQRIDDGRPNFKNFKKKNLIRKDPVQLFLAGPTINDAEMGEPYWQTESARPSARSQGMSQALPTFNEDEDDMPLLPRTRRRLLGEEGNEPTPPPPRRRQGAPESQELTSKKVAHKTPRNTRAVSTVSEGSVASLALSASTRSRGAKSGKSKPKPIVLADSDEELPPPTPATRSGRSGATSTLEGDGTRFSTRSTQTATVGRRKLLPADDDDGGMVFKGMTKKRRLA